MAVTIGSILMIAYQGIILRHYLPHKYKICLFDKHIGRIDAIVPNPGKIIRAIHHGAHIAYSYKTTSTARQIEKVELIHMPIAAAYDIHFIHLLLELCYFSLPMGYHCPNIFSLITYLLFELEKPLTLVEKQFYLCLFFAHLGLYSQEPPFDVEELKKFDIKKLQKKLDELSHNMFQSWLLHCIDFHPNKNKFKTIYKLKMKP